MPVHMEVWLILILKTSDILSVLVPVGITSSSDAFLCLCILAHKCCWRHEGWTPNQVSNKPSPHTKNSSWNKWLHHSSPQPPPEHKWIKINTSFEKKNKETGKTMKMLKLGFIECHAYFFWNLFHIVTLKKSKYGLVLR